MRLFLLTLLIIVMVPGDCECSDVTSQVLLECIDFLDFEWDAEKLETSTLNGEECTIDWSEVVLYREYYPEAGIPTILTNLGKGESFYRDGTVEQGQSYKYRIRATYNCPKAGSQNVIWQLFRNGVVQLSDRCIGWLKRDLSLTADFNKLEMHVLEGARLTISGSTLEEPLLKVHEGSTLDISGATITTGRIEGEDSSSGGMVTITGGTRLVNSYVLFYSNLGNECSNCTIIDDSDVKNPPNYPVSLNIRSDADVTIINNDIEGGKILVEDTPRLEIRDNKLRKTEIEVSTSSEHPADKVKIVNNQFSEGGRYIENYGGGAVIEGNSFAKKIDYVTYPGIYLYDGNVVFSSNYVDGQIQIGGGRDARPDVTLDNNIIVGTYPDTNDYTEGIHIGTGATVNINSCSIVNHKTGILIESGGQIDVRVRSSCIAGNNRGLVLGGSYDGPVPNTIVDVKSNWWGHATGPKNPISNPSGQGNECVWEGIDFAPWLAGNNCQSTPPADPDYVAPNGDCWEKMPCFDSIQEAIDAAVTGAVIRIADGIYGESITLNESKVLTLQGGWDSTFTAQSSYTTVDSITISNTTA